MLIYPHFHFRLADVPECKMPLGNIAKVVGPTIVGFSQKDLEPMQMINEAVKQSVVSITVGEERRGGGGARWDMLIEGGYRYSSLYMLAIEHC